jgi:hypothetical protein
LLLGCASSCVAPVFNSPITISASSEAAAHAKRLGQVRVEATTFVFVIIPIPFDPRDMYDDLLAKAKAAGGNAVVDVQIRNKENLFLVPLFYKSTWEAVGTAAVVGGG